MDPELAALTLAALARRCGEESEKFGRGEPSDGRFCREILRRALVARDQDAWALVFARYAPLVQGWAKRHPVRHLAAEEDDYWVNRAFERFWGAIGPENFDGFPTLGALLGYLHRCAVTALDDFGRGLRARPGRTVELDLLDRRGVGSPGPGDAPGRAEAEALWAAIRAELADAAEERVARLSFLQDLKPREIYEVDPAAFASIDDIYRIKRNLLERLRRNPAIRAFLDGE